MIVRWLIRLCVALAVIALVNGESTLNINLQNVLNRRNITEKKGMACAYADFNQDRNIDILHYHKGKLYVLLQITDTFLGAKDFSDMADKENAKWEIDLGEEYAEVACSVGDINYDGLTDVVVSTRKAKGENGHWTVRYFYSVPDTTSSSNSSHFVQGLNIIKAKHQVALIDVTGDGIHDLVGIQEDGENLLCLKGSETSENVLNDACEGIFLNWTGSLHPLMPILYGDVNNDRFAELVFMKHDKEGLKPEIWSRQGSIWVVDPKKQLPPPPSSVSFKHTLAPLLFDFNADAMMDIVVPVCKDEKCTTIDSIQTTYMKGDEWVKWTTIAVDLGSNTIVEEDDTLVRMKAGDYNLDAMSHEMEATQIRVKSAVDQMLFEVDKSYLRDMQKAMFNCSAKCCDDRKGAREVVERCIEKCNDPMRKAQRVLEGELEQLQSSLSRCAMTSYDKLVAEYGPDQKNYTPDQMSTFTSKLDKMVSVCADDHIKLLPTIKSRFAKSL